MKQIGLTRLKRSARGFLTGIFALGLLLGTAGETVLLGQTDGKSTDSRPVQSPAVLTPEEESLFSDTPTDSSDSSRSSEEGLDFSEEELDFSEEELSESVKEQPLMMLPALDSPALDSSAQSLPAPSSAVPNQPALKDSSALSEAGEPVPAFERLTPSQPPNLSELTAAESAWARFTPGSWILTRTIGLTFQLGKNLKSVTETRITLIEVTEKGYSLKREVSIKMGGRTYAKPAEVVSYNFFDIAADDRVTEEVLSPQSIKVGPRVVPCRLRRFTRTTPQMKELTTVWFSTVQSPYIFKTQTETYLPSSADNPNETLVRQSVTTLPRAVVNTLMGNDAMIWRTETVEEKANSVSRTQCFHSAQIPGGIKKEITIENDANGRPLYRSTTDVLDFHVK